MILFLYITTLFYRVRILSIWFMFEMAVGKTAFVEIWSHQNWRKMSAMWAVKILDNVKQNSHNMQTCSTKTKATSNCLFHVLRIGGICRLWYSDTLWVSTIFIILSRKRQIKRQPPKHTPRMKSEIQSWELLSHFRWGQVRGSRREGKFKYKLELKSRIFESLFEAI